MAVKAHPLKTFFGVVEDINDPEEKGRYRVRIFGYHTSMKGLLPTEELKWMYCTVSNQPMLAGLGQSATSYKVGSVVLGVFLSNDLQNGVIIGALSSTTKGVSDVHPLAKGENTLASAKQQVWNEPVDPYKAKYTYNQVLATQSGHVIEYDDTPDNERIHVHHKSGTYIEMYPDGQFVVKTKNNAWTLVGGNQGLYVEGDADIEVKGNTKLTVHGNVEETITGSKKTTITGDYDVITTGQYTLKASKVNIN